jgi:hypothetical protein
MDTAFTVHLREKLLGDLAAANCRADQRVAVALLGNLPNENFVCGSNGGGGATDYSEQFI